MQAQNRRTFLKNGLIICLGSGGAIQAVKRAGAFPSSAGQRWGMIIDLKRCTGCQSCVIACKLQNHTVENRFNTHIQEKEIGKFPESRVAFTPIQCNQCENPPCLPACPENAIFKLENGIVATDWNLCAGHGDCIEACPYGARFPDKRFGGKADKCDFCMDRLTRGLEPACVEACASKARIWGDFDAPGGELGRYLENDESGPRLPELGIQTRVLYNGVDQGAER